LVSFGIYQASLTKEGNEGGGSEFDKGRICVHVSGTVAELEPLSGMPTQLLPSGIERFVTEHAPLIQQACVVTSPEGDVVVVAGDVCVCVCVYGKVLGACPCV